MARSRAVTNLEKKPLLNLQGQSVILSDPRVDLQDYYQSILEQRPTRVSNSRKAQSLTNYFIEHYIDNGFNGIQACIAMGYPKRVAMVGHVAFLNTEHFQKMMHEYNVEIQKKHLLDFEYKLQKIKRIIDLCVPDDAVHYKECNITGALGAIAEANKMQGDYRQPEKIIGANNPFAKELMEAGKMLQEIEEQRQLELTYEKEF